MGVYMSDKYHNEDFKTTRIWDVINNSVDDLVNNTDIEEKTDRGHIVGYLCKKLAESGMIQNRLAQMVFIDVDSIMIELSNYVLGNIKKHTLPDFAVKLLEAGYDSPSLYLLAWPENSLEIEEDLHLTLDEMDLELPSKNEAALILIKYYLQKILNKEIVPTEGLEKICKEVLCKSDFEGKDTKFIYGHIEFHNLYCLYCEYEDMINPLVCISTIGRYKRIEEINAEILSHAEKFIQSFDTIKKRVLN